MSGLEVQAFCLPPDETCPLYVTAKRYRQQIQPEAGPTLVVLHSTSFHKEIWEPCLETMFKLADAKNQGFREAWAIESPNHGESALLNSDAFQSPQYATQFGCQGYAEAVHRFLLKGPVVFSNRRLIGLGHSLGANAILLLQDLVAGTSIRFESMILVEPLISPGGMADLFELRERLVASARNRQATWASREDAARCLVRAQAKRRKGRGKWDERVIEKFVTFGLVPTVDGKVTLACTREQEVAMYMDLRGPEAPVDVLNRISPTKPIHLVLGKVKDFIPGHVHDLLVDSKSGRIFASITHIPEVGHLIPQERPDELATVITEALLNPPAISEITRKSKL